MQKPMYALLALMSMTLSALADTYVERSCVAPPSGRVNMENVSGSVDVQGWDKEEVLVKATLGPKVKRLDFAHGGGRTRIKVIVPKRHGRGIDSKLEVFVPRGSTLDVQTVSASIEVEAVSGELELEAVSGKVRVVGDARSMTIETVSGSVGVQGSASTMHIEAISGSIKLEGDAEELVVETVSGSISLKGQYSTTKVEAISGTIGLAGSTGELAATTVSGGIDVERVLEKAQMDSISGRLRLIGGDMQAAELESVSGSIAYHGGLAQRGVLRASSNSGSIDVTLPRDIDAAFDATSFSGAIHNSFGPEPQRTSKHGPGRELRFVQGAGAAEVELRSFSGSIRIEAPQPAPS